MTTDRSIDLLEQLAALGIGYTRVDHPAVFTCEESERVVPSISGARTKNLFLRDKKGRRHLLLVVAQDKRIDLRLLGEAIGAKGLMLASDERLSRYLGVSPGSVSILALINDAQRDVELWVDRDVWSAGAILAHPLVNTATLSIAQRDLARFLEHSGHLPQVIELPP